MWKNISLTWGALDESVTPAWYAARAVVLGIPVDEIATCSLGIMVDGVLVAIPVTE